MKKLLIILALAAGFSLQAQDMTNLEIELQSWLSDASLKHASWGFCVMDTETGKVLAQHNKDASLVPASSVKAITTASAMALLGPDYTFETKLQYSGKIDDKGTLNGDLYITGGGDPTFGSSQYAGKGDYEALFQDWSIDLYHNAGVIKVNGKVVGDASVFEDADIPSSWVWTDMGNYYGAGASGLTIHDNLYYLVFKSAASKGGSTTVIRTEPSELMATDNHIGLEFINEVEAGAYGSGDNAYIYGAPYTYLRYVRGTIPPNQSEFKIKGSMPDPAYFAAWAFADAHSLNTYGGAFSGNPEVSTVRIMKNKGQKVAAESERTTVATYTSPTLKEIIKQTNYRSINLYAEHLLKAIGMDVRKDGSTDAGLSVIESYWAEGGLNISGFHQADGSGLSRMNNISAYHMAKIMQLMTKHQYFDDYYETLPVAGVSGTLASIGKGSSAQGRVAAKSGTMTRVVSYTGYVTTQSNQLLSFSIIVNNYEGSSSTVKSKISKLMAKMAELE